jgi:hypothetical protein
MNTSRFIDTEKGIVYTTVTGELTLEEIAADIAGLTSDPSFRPDMPRLFDLRGVTKLLTADEMARLAQTLRSSPGSKPSRRALLVGSDLSFGMFRMFTALADGGDVENRVFRDEAEARAWVEQAAAAGRK